MHLLKEPPGRINSEIPEEAAKRSYAGPAPLRTQRSSSPSNVSLQAQEQTQSRTVVYAATGLAVIEVPDWKPATLQSVNRNGKEQKFNYRSIPAACGTGVKRWMSRLILELKLRRSGANGNRSGGGINLSFYRKIL